MSIARKPGAVDEVEDVVAEAVSQVPFYGSRHLGGVGTPSIADVPVLERADVAACGTDIVRRGVSPEALRAVGSGGTTGRPLTTFRDAGDPLRETAALQRAWERFGLESGARTVVVVGRPVGVDGEVKHGGANVLWLGGDITAPDVLRRHHERLLDFDPALVRGYPSALTELAALMIEEGRPAPTGLVATGSSSERLMEHQRVLIRRAFGSSHVDLYGQSEHVALAATCPDSTTFHVDESYGFVEIVDDLDRPVEEADVVGALVATGLGNRAAPLIRYRTGDRASWADGRCGCGVDGLRLTTVEGRIRDFVIDADGRRRPLGLGFYGGLAALPQVRRFQFVQSGPGHLEVDVVVSSTDPQVLGRVRSVMNDLEAFDTAIVVVEALRHTPAGKVPLLWADPQTESP